MDEDYRENNLNSSESEVNEYVSRHVPEGPVYGENVQTPQQVPQYTAQQETQQAATQQAVPQQAVPQQAAQQAAPQQAAPQQAATQQAAPQQAAHQTAQQVRQYNKPEKKKSGFFRRFIAIAAAALLFGTVAGGAMVGVNWIAGSRTSSVYSSDNTPKAQSPVTESEPETKASVPNSNTVSNAIAMDVSAIVENAMPSVVAINNTMLYEGSNWFGQRQTYEVPSSGSGIIVGQNDTELLIVTNNHVVEDTKELTVTFIDDESVTAAVKGTDADSDLAIVAVQLSDIPADTLSSISVAVLGDSDSLKVGQGVIAIGNALGYGQSVTVGYVSALNREVQTDESTTRTLLQTDAAINPGNSGGALLNIKGEVIGINAAKYSDTDVEGMGYAIPISKAQSIIDELMTKKTRVEVSEEKQGYLGIQGQNVDTTISQAYGMPTGIYVFKIVDGGAAADSDLREKDIITKFDGQSVKTMADLQNILKYYSGGDTVELTVQSLQNSEYSERTVEITLGTKPAETNKN